MGRLSVVATPIGNLEDITLRSLRELKEAQTIACEDTRITKKLLSHFNVHTPVVTLVKIPRLLAEGKHVALVCDAGTPGISDPGLEIVSRARAQGARVEVVPGPSALSAAISVAGLRLPTFTFYGFLPLKKGREKLLKEITASERGSVLYESPHRILKTLALLAALLPARRRIGVFRELTKVHEESVVGPACEVYDYFLNHPDHVRGEFVIIVERL